MSILFRDSYSTERLWYISGPGDWQYIAHVGGGANVYGWHMFILKTCLDYTLGVGCVRNGPEMAICFLRFNVSN